jgi:hypothetical protein
MKKLTLIIAATFVVCGAFAQKKEQWGLKGGINLASQVADEGETNSRTGFHVGFFVESPIGNKIDIQPEFVYSQQGAKSTNSGTTYTEKWDYVNIPVMFKFYVNQSRSLSIDAGPQFGYLISGKVSGGGQSGDFYDNDNINKFDVSIGLGLSYKLESGFDVGIRFNIGGTEIIDGLSHKNSVAQLGAAYRF